MRAALMLLLLGCMLAFPAGVLAQEITETPTPTATPTITPTPANIGRVALADGGAAELVIDRTITYGDIAITLALMAVCACLFVFCLMYWAHKWIR